jgi:hypothetical protein
MGRLPYDRKRKDIAFALEQGWVFDRVTGGGHLRFTHPKTTIHMIMANSASDHRSIRNAISWTRRLTPRDDE